MGEFSIRAAVPTRLLGLQVVHAAVGFSILAGSVAASASGWIVTGPERAGDGSGRIAAPVRPLWKAPNHVEIAFVPSPPVFGLVVATDQATLDRFQTSVVPEDPAARRFYRLVATREDADAFESEVALLATLGHPFRVFDFRR